LILFVFIQTKFFSFAFIFGYVNREIVSTVSLFYLYQPLIEQTIFQKQFDFLIFQSISKNISSLLGANTFLQSLIVNYFSLVGFGWVLFYVALIQY